MWRNVVLKIATLMFCIMPSRLDSPPACAALSGTSTTFPYVSNSTTSFVNSTSVDNNTTTTDNSTLADPSTTDSSTLPDPTAADNSTSVDTPVDNSTSAVNSTSLESSSRRRRFWRRIAQDDLPDVALSWQQLCLVSGGDIVTGDPCVRLAGIDGINALLVDADPCAQQDNADAMIAFAKSAGVNNTDELIANAIAYRKHPRNAVDILGVVPSTPYCQRAPVNPELNDVVNEQLDGVDRGLFGSPGIPIVPFGATGTCPFGLTPDVATCTCANATNSGATSTPTADNSTAIGTSSDSLAMGISSDSGSSSNLTSTHVSSSAKVSTTASASGDLSSVDVGSSSASVATSSAASVSSTSASASSASSAVANVTSAASATLPAISTAPAATTTSSQTAGDANGVNG
ncbi:hypothetical protein C0995_002621 [Termitomyces sp. Mi166|nr:hypothetical protein C0995_002621 [Termitomyces sp. Mi166\